MKLKKVLSLVLALAMVMAFVPAMGLTASAADTVSLTDAQLLSYAKTLTPVFDGSSVASYTQDMAINAAWSAWSGGKAGNSVIDNTTTCLNVAGSASAPYIQTYNQSGTAAYGTVNAITTANEGKDNDYFVFHFIARAGGEWGDIALLDSTGAFITAFRMGTSGIQVKWGHSGWKNPYNKNADDYPSDSSYGNLVPSRTYTYSNTNEDNNNSATALTSGTSIIDILVRNYEATTDTNAYYTATFFVDGTAFQTFTYSDATVSGLGSILMCCGNTTNYSIIALQQPVV